MSTTPPEAPALPPDLIGKAPPKPIPHVKVSASYVRLAATCRAMVDIRYYLQGIWIGPRKEGGVYLVASDGHQAIAIIDPEGECSEATIINPTKATLAACPKALQFDRGAAEIRIISVEGEAALAVSDKQGLLAHVQPREAIIDYVNFPELKRILPDWKTMTPGAPPQVNAAYRNTLMPALSVGKFVGVQTFVDASQHKLIQRWAGMDNVVHIVMSMRGEPGTQAWVKMWGGA